MALILHNDPEFGRHPNWSTFSPTQLKAYRTRFPANVTNFISACFKLFQIGTDGNWFFNWIVRYEGGIDFVSSVVMLPYWPIHSLPFDSIYHRQTKMAVDAADIVDPTLDGQYCFYGMTNLKGRVENYKCDETFLDGISFVRSEGHYHIFRLSEPQSTLKGSSGAPIFRDDGKLVSLVVKRHPHQNDIIYGINFRPVMISLHIEANSVKSEEIYE